MSPSFHLLLIRVFGEREREKRVFFNNPPGGNTKLITREGKEKAEKNQCAFWKRERERENEYPHSVLIWREKEKKREKSPRGKQGKPLSYPLILTAFAAAAAAPSSLEGTTINQIESPPSTSFWYARPKACKGAKPQVAHTATSTRMKVAVSSFYARPREVCALFMLEEVLEKKNHGQPF